MDVAIIGAGLAGSLLALRLGQNGHSVDVYDRRPDPRESPGDGPSMNLGLSCRGLHALTRVGIREQVEAKTLPMRGRMVHSRNGRRRLTSYGAGGILAIQRGDLAGTLVDSATQLPDVRFHFRVRCTGLDKQSPLVQLTDETTGLAFTAQPDLVVGADGAFSLIRREMQRDERADHRQEFLDWGWTELHIPAGTGGRFVMEPSAFHLWPRGDVLLFAHPNHDGSFTASCVLPFHGKPSFESLRTKDDVDAFFLDTAPDLHPLVPDLSASFLSRRPTSLVSTSTSPWCHEGKVVLVGDACHAVYPFLAQGMNAAFEDALELADRLAASPHQVDVALAEYQERRKPNTDALAEMSYRNFHELRDKVRSPLTRLEQRTDKILERLLQERWMPMHAMVTNTTVPYALVQRRATRQRRILRGTAVGVAALGSGLLLRHRCS